MALMVYFNVFLVCLYNHQFTRHVAPSSDGGKYHPVKTAGSVLGEFVQRLTADAEKQCACKSIRVCVVFVQI